MASETRIDLTQFDFKQEAVRCLLQSQQVDEPSDLLLKEAQVWATLCLAEETSRR